MAEAKKESKPTAKVLTLAQKRIEIQKSVRSLSRDADNQYYRYKFISGSKLLGAMRPKMDELGVMLTQTFIPETMKISMVPGYNNKGEEDPSRSMVQVFMILRFIWTDSETGEQSEDIWPTAGQNTSLDKAIGSAMTYGERYYCLKQLHIASDEDDADSYKMNEKPEDEKPAEQPKRKMATQKIKQPADNVHAAQPAEQQPAHKSVLEPIHVTMETYNKGQLTKCIEYLVSKYDKQIARIPEEAIDYVKGRYEWEDDALKAVIIDASKRAFKKDLNQE